MQATAPNATTGSPVTREHLSGPVMPLFVPLLLSIPAFFPLAWAAFRAWSSGQVPTAFVQYDLPYYVANARQYFANGFHLTYGNPYAPYGTPAIYFQPHLLLVGLIQWLGLSPDLALIVFQIAAAGFASIVAARLYEQWVGWRTSAQKLGFVCFFWGGGVLSLAGAFFGVFMHVRFTKAIVQLDPGDGWWMLNFGRNLVYPTEAYYHGLYLLAILLLVRKRFAATLVVAAILSASHPFTGLSLALVLVVYSSLELLLKSGEASWKLLVGSCAVVVLHVGYYLVFLNRFADHRTLQLQWQLDWPYTFWTFVPALYLVGILAFGRLTRWKYLAPVLRQPRMRLCLIWFAVIFALSQHDLVIRPRQPIHFTHGYDWIALFFLATPALIAMLERLQSIRRIPVRIVALGCFLALFLSDNLLWLVSFSDPAVQRYAIILTPDEKNALDWLHAHASAPAYVASTDRWINYLPPTYTNVRGWSGHDYNTPQISERRAEVAAAFSSGKLIPSSNPIYYIPTRNLHWTAPAGARLVYSNSSFDVWLFEPVRAQVTAN